MAQALFCLMELRARAGLAVVSSGAICLLPHGCCSISIPLLDHVRRLVKLSWMRQAPPALCHGSFVSALNAARALFAEREGVEMLLQGGPRRASHATVSPLPRVRAPKP
jgi:hypothetical protein